jgi:hypothetical protein
MNCRANEVKINKTPQQTNGYEQDHICRSIMTATNYLNSRLRPNQVHELTYEELDRDPEAGDILRRCVAMHISRRWRPCETYVAGWHTRLVPVVAMHTSRRWLPYTSYRFLRRWLPCTPFVSGCHSLSKYASSFNVLVVVSQKCSSTNLIIEQLWLVWALLRTKMHLPKNTLRFLRLLDGRFGGLVV